MPRSHSKILRRVLAAALCLAAAAPAVGSEGEAARNRLADEASPYLQLHAGNPVDWYPWGREALSRARAENRPIFLSVGYSTCFWCHVMEREVFSDPQIAALMNEHFVNIKVDREERPDLDELYMTATQAMTGSGGWPNSVFLTPDGVPFFAGTYFPPKDARGRPGFPRVLRGIVEAWRERRGDVLGVAARVRRQIEDRATPPPRANQSFDPGALLADAARDLARAYEPEHGGFSRGVKFPSPPKLELLLAAHAENAHPEALAMLTRTLDEIALGGIRDHLGGGFHRYATEPTWSIPHFEKMLYDNAQLLGVYARAYERTGRPLYRQVVIDTAAYLEREMRHPDGGFYSAQDAEVGGREGRSYLWTRGRIAGVLGEERSRALLSVYRLAPMPDGHGAVLRVRLPLGPLLEGRDASDAAALLGAFDADRARLLAARNRRPQPLRDEKVLAAWNGLAIRGLVLAARAVDRPHLLRLAGAAADFVLERLRAPDGRLHRSYIAGQRREAAVLDDYAFLADALLALHRASGAARRLREARALADPMLADYQDRRAGGFYASAAGDLPVRPREIRDDVLPSGAGVALRVLRTLAAVTGEARYARAAERTAVSLGGLFAHSPVSVGTAVVALATTPADGTRPAAGTAAANAPAAAPAARESLPRSDDHVRVTVERDAAGQLRVHLRVDEGWHVNANPASLGFLVPTTVEIEAPQAATVHYPEGTSFRPEFSPAALSTYSGRVEIRIEIDDAASSPLPLAVRYQACDATRCLPPATSRVVSP